MSCRFIVDLSEMVYFFISNLPPCLFFLSVTLKTMPGNKAKFLHFSSHHNMFGTF